jgi:hypothetical protein
MTSSPPIPATCGHWPKPPGSTSTSSPSEPPGSRTCIRTVAGRANCLGPGDGGRLRMAGWRELRILAALTSSGSQVGANVQRYQATPGHMQPRKPQVNSTHGHMQPRPATAGVCMACKSWCPLRGRRAGRENAGLLPLSADRGWLRLRWGCYGVFRCWGSAAGRIGVVAR